MVNFVMHILPELYEREETDIGNKTDESRSKC